MTLHRTKGLRKTLFQNLNKKELQEVKKDYPNMFVKAVPTSLKKLGIKPLSKQRKTTVASAKRKAWSAFSLYIRMKDSVDGVNECYTCGKVFPIKKLQAGHGLGGRSNAVLFNEDLVKPQCIGCNMFANGRYPVFTRKLIEELGMDGYDQLVKESNQVVKYTLSDYLELARFYTEQTEKL